MWPITGIVCLKQKTEHVQYISYDDSILGNTYMHNLNGSIRYLLYNYNAQINDVFLLNILNNSVCKFCLCINHPILI